MEANYIFTSDPLFLNERGAPEAGAQSFSSAAVSRKLYLVLRNVALWTFIFLVYVLLVLGGVMIWCYIG